MVQKQIRQFFYTKKIMLLGMFLFFGLATLETQEVTEDDNQEIRSAQRRRKHGLENSQGLNKRQSHNQESIWILSQNQKKEATEDELNRLFNVFPEFTQQIFLINENGIPEITSLFLKQDLFFVVENGRKVNKIERAVQNDEGCVICYEQFNQMKQKEVFVYNCLQIVLHMVCYECYLLWFKTQKKNRLPSICPKCRAISIPSNTERVSRRDKIKKLKEIGSINYMARDQNNTSRWKLDSRKKNYDEEIKQETGVDANDWVVVDWLDRGNMEVLETNLDKPKDLENYHLVLLEQFQFQRVGFNGQDEREIYFVFTENNRLKISHKRSVVFDEKEPPVAQYPVGATIKNTNFKGTHIISSNVYKKSVCNFYNILVFNKENIEYLRKTKGLFVFKSNLMHISIGLEGDTLLSKKDIEEILVLNDHIGLLCDNVKNLALIKTDYCGFLSPIDQRKIDNIVGMRNEKKLQTKTKYLYLIEDDCFLLPLFELSNRLDHISLTITHQMVERVDFPFQEILKELNQMFVGVKLREYHFSVFFIDYAVVLLLYFGEVIVKNEEIHISIYEKRGNCNFDTLQCLINNQITANQNYQQLCLNDEIVDFDLAKKFIKNLSLCHLIIFSDIKEINDYFVEKKKKQLLMRGNLKKLVLYNYAIKYLLYFKQGSNNINILQLSFIFSKNEKYLWMSSILQRINGNGIRFHLPSNNSLRIFSDSGEEIEIELKRVIVFSDSGLNSF